MAPTLNRRQRRRLIRQLGVQEAADAMFEQDDRGAAALSRMIAKPVFGEAESPKSFALAQILIAELPACLTATEWAAVSAYKLRVIQESVDDVGARVDEVGGDVQLVSKSIDDLRQLLIARDDAPSTNPAALIQEILETLGLRDEYLAIEAMEATDPASAAPRLSKIIERVTAEGHQAQARPLIKQRAALLTRAGAINAADAWLPIVDDFLKLGLGGGLHEPLKAWQSRAKRRTALAPRPARDRECFRGLGLRRCTRRGAHSAGAGGDGGR